VRWSFVAVSSPFDKLRKRLRQARDEDGKNSSALTLSLSKCEGAC